MLVTTLEDMERIVANRGDLSWEGWDVVKIIRSTNAIYSKEGAFVNGTWVKRKVFPLTEYGWHLPNSIGRADAQVAR